MPVATFLRVNCTRQIILLLYAEIVWPKDVGGGLKAIVVVVVTGTYLRRNVYPLLTRVYRDPIVVKVIRRTIVAGDRREIGNRNDTVLLCTFLFSPFPPVRRLRVHCRRRSRVPPPRSVCTHTLAQMYNCLLLSLEDIHGHSNLSKTTDDTHTHTYTRARGTRAQVDARASRTSVHYNSRFYYSEKGLRPDTTTVVGLSV